ncbi:MAG TPA: 4-alpha-glucanotransferase [Candidatus Obscuribacterales bacterium]
MSDSKRASGILLHPTSLPGRFGIGDLGQPAYRFADFLAAGAQSFWQVLPLGPTGFGDSPYQCLSAFAGNPLLISLDGLATEGLLDSRELTHAPQFPVRTVDFPAVIAFKGDMLRKAFDRFRSAAGGKARDDFSAFIRKHARWLEDYALYQALKDAQGGRPWSEWPRALALREPEALSSAGKELEHEIEAVKFCQYLFFKQWLELREHCHRCGIRIIGDIPIFVAYDSADVWAHPRLFKLNRDGTLKVVAGVPPDYFSATGQRWGNPIYNWSRLRKDGYRWWVERFRSVFELTDVVRVDHFRGFAACWEIPAREPTAVKGRWVKVPGMQILNAVKQEFDELPVIAEDLGVITPDVIALRERFGFPGMRILQFAFRDEENIDLPHNYVANTVVYTGTHDNDTAVGWFHSQAGKGSTRSAEQIERERAFCLEYLNTTGKEIHWDFIRAVLASVSATAIIPLQDVLGLDSSARMNTPATQEGNWRWRFAAEDITPAARDRLKRLTELYGRRQIFL